MILLSFKELREKANLTSIEIINALGVDFQTIKGWESGEKMNLNQAKLIRDIVKDRYPCDITYWAGEPDDCYFCRFPD